MALDRQEYPAMLATLQPSQAVDILNERVRLVGNINTGIADWLQERRRLEEQYSQGLRKLARRPAIADPQELGVFATPMSALISALDTLADTHHNLASKIESDVESPLRLFNTSHREMAAMGNIQGNLSSLAKDIDGAQKKLDKLGGKATAQKTAAANSDVEKARAQWEAQAPFVFESLQSLDESRLNHLRDVLTQFQTHEVDKVERNRIAAEQCLNVLLTVETADEIKTFAMRTASEDRPQTARRPAAMQQSGSVASLAPPTPSGAAADDRASQRSDSVSDLPTPKPEKPRGLRRLGTVLGRRRESKIPMGAGRIGESPERTPEKKSRMPNFGRKKEQPTLEPPREDEDERPRSPLRTVSSRSDADREAETVPTTNGAVEAIIPNGSHQNDLAGLSLSDATRQTSETATPGEADPVKTDKGKSNAIDSITAAEQEAAEASGNATSTSAFKVDIKDAPTDREGDDGDALTSMANTLKLHAPPVGGSRRQGTVRGRRDNRASVYDSLPAPILNQQPSTRSMSESRHPIPEDPAVTSTSTVPVASPQPSSTQPFAPTSSLTPFAAAAGIGGAGAAAGAAALTMPHSPLSAARPASAQRTDDTTSIRSGRSHSSAASISHRHPDLSSAGPGLNASIIETVSAWFEHGTLARSAVIGEVALQNNDSGSDADAHASRGLRLASFADIDKVAPNPAFISNDASQPGDSASGGASYQLNLGQLGRGRQQVAFKYQLSPSATAGGAGLVPLVLTPAWKIEQGQTSVILSYGLHEGFAPATNEGDGAEVKLKDVTLSLHLGEGTKAGSCLSKPVGTFNKERGVIYWSLGDVSLKKGEMGKVLARFGTEGEGKIGRAEARWVLEGAGSRVGIEVKEKGEEDPFSDGEVVKDEWRGLEGTKRRAVAGTYQGT